jgi:DnaK suppressor protein
MPICRQMLAAPAASFSGSSREPTQLLEPGLAGVVQYHPQFLRKMSMVMNQSEASKYSALLMAKRDEIRRRSPQREDIWIVRSNDDIESIQLAGEREFAVRTLERETRSLVQIGASLKRIEHGEFGICLDCEEPISPKRLAAVPWAEYCLSCQELHDARRADSDSLPKLAA